MNALLHRYGDLALACLLALFFFIWPQTDLALAARFYHPGQGFPASHTWWVKTIYELVAEAWIIVPALLLLLLAGFVPAFRTRWAPRRKAVLFLLVALFAGPGLVVNSIMKDHIGRPRPVHLAKFGGTASFTRPIPAVSQCRRNCAFPSGHAAAAFYLMAGYWPARRKRWLAAGIAFGLFVGILRMAMGAHFLSDILFAGLVVHFTCRALAWLFGFSRAPVTREVAEAVPGLRGAHAGSP